MFKAKLTFPAALLAILCAHSVAQDQDAAADPPSRIARLNHADGVVSMQPAGTEDWTPAEVNRPFTTGDSLYTDNQSRAELHLDSAIIRAGEYTNIAFLTLNDQTTQLSLTEGDLAITLRRLGPKQSFEIDSPNSSITLLRPGHYRFRIASDGSLTFLVVRTGQAEATGGGRAFSVPPGDSISFTGSDNVAADGEPAPPPDDFDDWCHQRDKTEAQPANAPNYLPTTMVGYEDMNSYGDWNNEPTYGVVWYPRNVASGWAPYHNGHWAWIEPWGWTWVDDAPWGFAPFHYGRWVFVSGRWGWAPGPVVVVPNRPAIRPVYAPALVAWFGGAHFGVGINIGGGGPSLGWVPLGFGEVYTPSYHCSPRYFSNVNVTNTTIVSTVNIRNVYNTVYVNKVAYNQTFVNVHAPNAVTVMPHAAFASGRSVAQAAVVLQAHQVQNLHFSESGVIAPPVAPTHQALLSNRPASNGSPVARPAQQIAARRVITQTAPAAAPASFQARQPYLQQHAGETHNFTAMHTQVAPKNSPPQPNRVAAVQPHVQPKPSSPPKPHSANSAPRAYPVREHASHPAPKPEPKKGKPQR